MSNWSLCVRLSLSGLGKITLLSREKSGNWGACRSTTLLPSQRGYWQFHSVNLHIPRRKCTSYVILPMSKSRMGFGVFIWFLMCKSLSGMNSEDFSPGLHKQCLCFGPHPKAGRFLQSPLLQKHHVGLTEVQRAGVPCPWGMLSGISQGKSSPCKCCPGWEPVSPTRVWPQKPRWCCSHGALEPMGAWCALHCFVFCLFSSFLPLVKCFVLSFVRFYYIVVVLKTVRSLSCKWKDMPFDPCICELLLLSWQKGTPRSILAD